MLFGSFTRVSFASGVDRKRSLPSMQKGCSNRPGPRYHSTKIDFQLVKDSFEETCGMLGSAVCGGRCITGASKTPDRQTTRPRTTESAQLEANESSALDMKSVTSSRCRPRMPPKQKENFPSVTG